MYKKLIRQIKEIKKLEKSQPAIKFPNFPKAETRPDQQVNRIQSPRQAKIFEKVYESKAKEAHPEIKNIPGSGLAGTYAEKIAGGVEQRKKNNPKASQMYGLSASFRPSEDKPKAKPVSIVAADAGDQTVAHEAAHHSFADLSNKYSIPAKHMQQLTERMTRFLHNDDKDALSTYLQDRGYSAAHPGFHEELVNATRDVLINTNKHKPLIEKANQGLNNNINFGRIKRAWKQMVDFTHSLTPDNFYDKIK